MCSERDAQGGSHNRGRAVTEPTDARVGSCASAVQTVGLQGRRVAMAGPNKRCACMQASHSGYRSRCRTTMPTFFAAASRFCMRYTLAGHFRSPPCCLIAPARRPSQTRCRNSVRTRSCKVSARTRVHVWTRASPSAALLALEWCRRCSHGLLYLYAGQSVRFGAAANGALTSVCRARTGLGCLRMGSNVCCKPNVRAGREAASGSAACSHVHWRPARTGFQTPTSDWLAHKKRPPDQHGARCRHPATCCN